MKTIFILPNDQSLVGRKVMGVHWVEQSWVEVLFVGSGQVFFKEASGNESCATLQYEYYLQEDPPFIDWFKVKWAREKGTNNFLDVASSFLIKKIEFHSLKANLPNEQTPSHFNHFMSERYEPIKFTQTLKVGDKISNGMEFLEIRRVTAEGFEGRILKAEDPTVISCAYYGHSDDWELVRNADEFVGNLDKPAVKDSLTTEGARGTRLAPALKRIWGGKMWQITPMLFPSLEEAEKYHQPVNDVLWPAIPNKDGYYEVEVGE